MPAMEIPCPNCGSHLKIPDRSFLGKKGKCGKCGHRFIMTEPAPIQFELANPMPRADETMVGEFVKYVPENAPQEHFGGHTPAPPPLPSFRQAAPMAQAAPPMMPPPALAIGIPQVTEAESTSSARLRSRKKKPGGMMYLLIGVGALVLIAGGTAAYFAFAPPSSPKKGTKSGSGKPADAPKTPSKTKQKIEEDEDDSSAGLPQPLDMKMMPDGVEILVHFRPAKLWKDEGVYKEFRFALGPLAIWLEGVLKAETLQDPLNLDEVLIGVIPGARGTPYKLCGVIRTVKENKQSELLSALQAPAEQSGPKEIYVNERRAWIIVDKRTYAFAPPEDKDKLVEYFDNATQPRQEMADLLPATDRRRLFTVAAIASTLTEQEDVLIPAEVRPFLRQLVEWCSMDVKGCAWSLQMDEDDEVFDSEIVLVPDVTLSAGKLKMRFEEKCEQTPRAFLDLVLMTHPDTVGMRKLVGRLPAMVKAYAMTTTFRSEHRFIRMRTRLPQKAAPNLAAAGLFAWNLTTRPSFGDAQPTDQPTGPTKPEDNTTIAERLEKVIPEVDFRDDMMYVAINTIGDEIGVTFHLEGNDLKQAGVTQNVKQKFKMQNVKATAVLDKILTKEKLCIYINESTKKVHVTSLAAASDRGWKPYPLTDK